MVAHGRDGWTLADYEWDPATHVGTFTYERKRVDTGEIQEKTVTKMQHGDDWRF